MNQIDLRTYTEHYCESCGNFGELVQIEGKWVCVVCKEMCEDQKRNDLVENEKEEQILEYLEGLICLTCYIPCESSWNYLKKKYDWSLKPMATRSRLKQIVKHLIETDSSGLPHWAIEEGKTDYSFDHLVEIALNQMKNEGLITEDRSVSSTGRPYFSYSLTMKSLDFVLSNLLPRTSSKLLRVIDAFSRKRPLVTLETPVPLI